MQFLKGISFAIQKSLLNKVFDLPVMSITYRGSCKLYTQLAFPYFAHPTRPLALRRVVSASDPPSLHPVKRDKRYTWNEKSVDPIDHKLVAPSLDGFLIRDGTDQKTFILKEYYQEGLNHLLTSSHFYRA